MSFSKKQKGIGLIEGIFYIALLAVFLVVVVNVLNSLLQSYGNFKITGEIEQSALVTMDRISREIRDAESIDMVNSVFDTNPGTLVLNTTDVSDNSRKVEFLVSGGVIRVKENDSDKGPLSISGVVVDNFVLRKIDTGKSEAVRIELALSATKGGVSRDLNFYNTETLRDSY